MAEERTGRVNSGDVSLFYRAFGAPGATPILILHGTNYYDSYDWIGVASALASDREVVTPDRRGMGESTWSPSKDYSLDAMLDDMLAVIAAMKWDKVIVMGHSGAGPPRHLVCSQFPGADQQTGAGRQPDEPGRSSADRQFHGQSAARISISRWSDGAVRQTEQSAAVRT